MEILPNFQAVFGPLPPPGQGPKIVTMDIELKEEWKNAPLRGKCFPMPERDVQEIDRQVQELVDAKLVEPYPTGTYPKYCTPTFLVDKKDSKVRRMVGNYVKLNQRTKPHAAFLPPMDVLVENLAKFKWKSKLDLRSGFWQVSLTPRAQELTSFCTPSGRIFRWTCMPFGLQGAPGIIQEMMEEVCCRTRAKLKETFPKVEHFFLSAFFDDIGVGTQNDKDHVQVLQILFQVCQDHKIRIKLSKCDILKQSLDYLGYHIEENMWSPSQSKVQSILKAKVQNLRDLHSFLGAANFYRRHIRNFTFSSAPLTEKLKKDVPWSWGPVEKSAFEELRQKLASPNKLGVPHPNGEILMVTDASDIGGGSTLFQWQPKDFSQVTPSKFQTSGVDSQGNFTHNYQGDHHLVPIGHWNWKWSPTRQKYPTYEQEILAGILTLASQFRLVANRKIVWFCDNQAVRHFPDQAPPNNPRVRRWFLFLTTFPLKIVHIPGLKNEFCDFLSRSAFDERIQMKTEKLAQEVFSRMDMQLDLSLKVFSLTLPFPILCDDYSPDLSDIWDQLEERDPKTIDGKVWFRTSDKLFCERLLVIPPLFTLPALVFTHEKFGHMGVERTLMCFLQNLFSPVPKSELMGVCKVVVENCEICKLTKANTPKDRGIVSALPIPQIVNSLLYIDFVNMDEWNGFTYILTIVDGLNRVRVG